MDEMKERKKKREKIRSEEEVEETNHPSRRWDWRR